MYLTQGESAVNALFNTPLDLRKLLTASHFLMPSQINAYH